MSKLTVMMAALRRPLCRRLSLRLAHLPSNSGVKTDANSDSMAMRTRYMILNECRPRPLLHSPNLQYAPEAVGGSRDRDLEAHPAAGGPVDVVKSSGASKSGHVHVAAVVPRTLVYLN